MDEGELDISNVDAFLSSNMGEFANNCDDNLWDGISDIQPKGPPVYNCSMNHRWAGQDSLECQNTHACTHTHTCNPPGPDFSHTHTCVHVHTKIVSGPTEDKTTSNTDDTAESTEKKSKKRPSGNREAVRKYREKKKARAASLEDEVVKLRAMNQQLMRRLQSQAVLEAEIARLKCLLVDIRGRIEGEIGSFPYQKSLNSNLSNPSLPGSYVMNPCNIQCGDQVYCPNLGTDGKSAESVSLNGQGLRACELENMQCSLNQNSGLKDLSGSGDVQMAPKVNSSISNKRRGGGRAAMAS